MVYIPIGQPFETEEEKRRRMQISTQQPTPLPGAAPVVPPTAPTARPVAPVVGPQEPSDYTTPTTATNRNQMRVTQEATTIRKMQENREEPIRFDPQMERLKAYERSQVITERRAEARGQRIGEPSPRQIQRGFEKVNAILEGRETDRPLTGEEFDALRPRLMESRQGRRLLGVVEQDLQTAATRIQQALPTATSARDLESLADNLNPLVRPQVSRMIQGMLDRKVSGDERGGGKTFREVMEKNREKVALEEIAQTYRDLGYADAAVVGTEVKHGPISPEHAQILEERKKRITMQVEAARASDLNEKQYANYAEPGETMEEFMARPTAPVYEVTPEGNFKLRAVTEADRKAYDERKAMRAFVAIGTGEKTVTEATDDELDRMAESYPIDKLTPYRVKDKRAQATPMTPEQAGSLAGEAGVTIVDEGEPSTITLPAAGETGVVNDILNTVRTTIEAGEQAPDLNTAAAETLAKQLKQSGSAVTRSDFARLTTSLADQARAQLDKQVEADRAVMARELNRSVTPILERLTTQTGDFEERYKEAANARDIALQGKLTADSGRPDIEAVALDLLKQDIDMAGVSPDAAYMMNAALQELAQNPDNSVIPVPLRAAFDARVNALQRGVVDLQAQRQQVAQQQEAIRAKWGPQAGVVFQSPDSAQERVVFDLTDIGEKRMYLDWQNASPTKQESIVAQWKAKQDAIAKQSVRQQYETEHPNHAVAWVTGVGDKPDEPVLFPKTPDGEQRRERFEQYSDEERRTKIASEREWANRYAEASADAKEQTATLKQGLMTVKTARVLPAPAALTGTALQEYNKNPIREVAYEVVDPQSPDDWVDYGVTLREQFSRYPALMDEVTAAYNDSYRKWTAKQEKQAAAKSGGPNAEAWWRKGLVNLIPFTGPPPKEAATKPTPGPPAAAPKEERRYTAEEARKLPKGTSFLDIEGRRREKTQ